jgi:shikimate kinase/nucleoside-diphosphate-sugar epimerase
MKFLIVGCGMVGERLADGLHAQGHEVIGLTHHESSAQRLASLKPWLVGACDITDAAQVAALAQRHGPIDGWVHCASSGRGGAEAYEAVYFRGQQHLFEHFPGAHAVYAGSTSVYDQVDGSWVDEQSWAEPVRPTGQWLRRSENLALEAGGGVVRLGGLYGPGRSHLLKNFLLGQGGLEVTAEAPDGRYLNVIHVQDAANALAHVLQLRLRGIFNAVDTSPTLQRECLQRLVTLFGGRLPAEVPADGGRKRGWSHKRVSSQKLRSTGWTPLYGSYLDALEQDPELVSSILAEVQQELAEGAPRRGNVLLVGLMGCGKTTVGRLVARLLGFHFVDTDQQIIKRAGCSIPEIFAQQGEVGFRRHESAVLRSLLGSNGLVVATGGGMVTQEVNRPLLRHLGFVTWLEAPVARLVERTRGNQDRPLLRDQDNLEVRLRDLLEQRSPWYAEVADLRLQTDGLNPQESAYGIAESARHFFAARGREQGQQEG